MRPLRATVLAGSAVLAAGAVAAAAVGLGGRGGPPARAGTATPRPATARVTRTTLTKSEQVNGTIGYGTPVPVTAPGQGTVTWLPTPGAVVRRGRPVYRVDDRPVPLFYGDLPFYRSLVVGDGGPDVTELERNLAALGYAGFTVDRDYTSATAAAVTDWQQDRSLTGTGVFDPASVVLAPGAVRIAALDVRPGDPAGGRVLDRTGTTRVVQVPLDVALQGLVKAGTAATVTLPNGRTVAGRVRSAGRVATAGSQPDDPATIAVTVAVADQSGLGTLDRAPVTVTLVSETARDVLTVPVVALVALAGGGTAVQVVTGSTSRYVTVRLGMFADGRVQVSAPGLTAGTRVVVPS